MSEQEFLDKMMEIMDTEYPLAMDTKLDDVDEWDSLSHVQLVAAIEDAFSIKFKSREILSWENIGDLIDSIEKKV